MTSVWKHIDRLKKRHDQDLQRTAKALASRGWSGPVVDESGLWTATLGHEAPHDGEPPVRVTARTSAELLQRVDERRALLEMATMARLG